MPDCRMAGKGTAAQLDARGAARSRPFGNRIDVQTLDCGGHQPQLAHAEDQYRALRPGQNGEAVVDGRDGRLALRKNAGGEPARNTLVLLHREHQRKGIAVVAAVVGHHVALGEGHVVVFGIVQGGHLDRHVNRIERLAGLGIGHLDQLLAGHLNVERAVARRLPLGRGEVLDVERRSDTYGLLLVRGVELHAVGIKHVVHTGIQDARIVDAVARFRGLLHPLVPLHPGHGGRHRLVVAEIIPLDEGHVGVVGQILLDGNLCELIEQRSVLGLDPQPRRAIGEVLDRQGNRRLARRDVDAGEGRSRERHTLGGQRLHGEAVGRTERERTSALAAQLDRRCGSLAQQQRVELLAHHLVEAVGILGGILHGRPPEGEQHGLRGALLALPDGGSRQRQITLPVGGVAGDGAEQQYSHYPNLEPTINQIFHKH